MVYVENYMIAQYVRENLPTQQLTAYTGTMYEM